MARKKKEPPEPLPCKCGDIGVPLRPRGGRLYDFCTRHLPRNEGPADWDLTGEEAPEA